MQTPPLIKVDKKQTDPTIHTKSKARYPLMKFSEVQSAQNHHAVSGAVLSTRGKVKRAEKTD